MPMRDYKALSATEAEELHQQELARHDATLQSLKDRVAVTGGDPAALDGTRESLVPLWRWYVGWYQAGRAHEPAGPLPPWYSRGDAPQEVDLPDALFVVADELGHYLEEVALQTVPGAHWRLVGERDGVRYVDYQKTGVALADDDLVGQDLAWIKCLRVRDGQNLEDRALLDIFGRRVAHVDAQPEPSQTQAKDAVSRCETVRISAAC